MLSGWPGGIVGELGLLNNRMFLRILVLERSLHFASLAIGDVVSLPLLLYHAYNHLKLPGIQFLPHFAMV
jgi:hypothetical protein